MRLRIHFFAVGKYGILWYVCAHPSVKRPALNIALGKIQKTTHRPSVSELDEAQKNQKRFMTNVGPSKTLYGRVRSFRNALWPTYVLPKRFMAELGHSKNALWPT